MPRFQDNWVVDKTMFEYVSGGSCACCGFPHLYPDGITGLINSISDFETDAAQAEVSALQQSPWPPDMRDQVWGDRVRLRYKMKKEMKTYKEFWEKHSEALEKWCRQQGGVVLRKIFQMPRSGITERLNSQYGIHSAYAVVLCTVVEQVSKFKMTEYKTDARGKAEVDFEEALLFDRRGGFTLDIANSDGSVNEQVLAVWLERLKTLGGPKLLERGPSTSASNNDDDEEEQAGDADAGQERDPDDATATGPSFRGDRRIVRLLIARYWADMMIKQYERYLQETESKNDAVAEGDNATSDNSDNGVAQVEKSMAEKLSVNVETEKKVESD